MANTFKMEERGRKKTRRRSLTVVNPFLSMKNILRRNKSRLNRSLSRERSQSPPRFVTGIVEHAHQVESDNQTPSPPIYLVVHVGLNGSILPPDPSSKFGALVCECTDPLSFTVGKHVTFVTKLPEPQIGKEHYVSSPFVVPEVTESYKKCQKSFPILFRVDSLFGSSIGQPINDSISFVALKTSVYNHLASLEKSFNEDQNIYHVYEKIFNIEVPSAPPLSSSSSSSDEGSLHQQEDISAPGAAASPVVNVGVSPAVGGVGVPAPPAPQQQPSVTTRSGILFLADQPQSLTKIPKLRKNRLIENYVSSWSRDHQALFISQNSIRKTLEFFPLQESPALNPFDPSVKSDHLFVSMFDWSQLANQTPYASVELSSRVKRWYSFLLQGIVNRSLFSSVGSGNSDSESSLSTSTISRITKASKTSRKSRRASSNERDEHPTQRDIQSNEQEIEQEIVPLPSLPTLIPSISVEVFTPPILEKSDCPDLFKVFFSLKALPQPSTSQNGKTIQEPMRSVAPKFPKRMLSLVKEINMPNLLSDEFIGYAKAYQAIVNERRFCLLEVSKTSDVHISIQNDASVLYRTGKGKVLDDLKRNAPSLRDHRLDHLNTSELESFFFQARTFLLNNSIPYWSFGDIFLNNKTFGTDIYNKLSEVLYGYPSFKTTLRQFSCFFESTIRSMLPVQESFPSTENRILAAHKSVLLGPVPSADYTKISLQADAKELLMKSPFYKQNQSTFSEELKRTFIESYKTNLLVKIISDTVYEKNLIQLLIASDKYRALDLVPSHILIQNLENLILVEQKSNAYEVSAIRSTSTSRGARPKSKPTTTSRRGSKSPRSNPRPRSSSSPRSPSSPRAPSAPSSPRPPSPRSSSPRAPTGQTACDICLLYSFDPRWCRQQDHCRISGHQPTTNKSETRERKIRLGDFSFFVLKKDCNKCFNPRVLGNPPPWQPTLLTRPPPPPSSQWPFPPPPHSAAARVPSTRQQSPPSSPSSRRFPSERGLR